MNIYIFLKCILDRELYLEDKIKSCNQEVKSLRGKYTDKYNLNRNIEGQNKFNI